MPLEVRVVPHRRAQFYRRMPAHPSKRLSPSARAREKAYAESRPPMGQIIDDVRSGRRAGYTYTGGYFFDIDDPKSMDVLYDRLGPRPLFAIARTNRTLEEFERRGLKPDIGWNFGVALWKDEKGTVYLDDVTVHTDIDDETALRIARERDQFVILKVDGRTRSFAFLEAPCYDVVIRGKGANRTFEPRREDLCL